MKGAIAMNKVLLVEGDVDDAFFNSIFGKWETVADIEVAIGGGVPNIFEKLKTLVRTGIRQLGIALDINDKDEEHVYKKVFDILVSNDLIECLRKTIDSLKPDCIELISSKQLLDLTKAIIGFRASPAVFTKEVVDNSNSEILEGVIKDLKRILQN